MLCSRSFVLFLCLLLAIQALGFNSRRRGQKPKGVAKRSLPTLNIDKDVEDIFVGTTWKGDAIVLCKESGSQLLTGDFNDDNHQDMLCHNNVTGHAKIYYAGCVENDLFSNDKVWEKELNWCTEPATKLYVGHFNGDGRSDMLCHNEESGGVTVALAKPGGIFEEALLEQELEWCNLENKEMLVADFDADGRDDLLCHDKISGHKTMIFAMPDGRFTDSLWAVEMDLCHSTDSKLLTGDVNGDRRADLICHDQQGHVHVALASKTGLFYDQPWTGDLNWCVGESEMLNIGDFNKDRRSDMLCHDDKGNKKIAFASTKGTFTGSDWKKSMQWCLKGNQLLIADVNGDSGDDLLCHNPSTGKQMVSLNQLP